MKNPRALAMILVSLIIGLVAVVMASQWMAQQATVAATKVVVAAVDVNLGSKLTPDMFKTVDWPSGSIPVGAFTDPKDVDGRVIKTSLTRGEALIEAKLAPVGTKGGLSAVVAEGKRAMTVRVNDVVGVAGFALPGNYVDILVSTQDEHANTSGKDRTISKIVMERILVLAVAQEASRDETKPKVVNAVTLEVTPEEAEKLDLARSVGSLSLVLRNQVETHAADTSGATKTSLFKEKEESKSTPVKDGLPPLAHKQRTASTSVKRDCVEVFTGITRSYECF